MNTKLLRSLGLAENEIVVYKAIFKDREILPSELAKVTGIKRTTAYSVVHSLVEKGLVIEDTTKRPRTVSLATGGEIENAISIEKKRSQEKQDLLIKLSQEVENREAEESYPVPQIRFVEESKVAQFLNKRIEIWNENMKKVDPVFWGYQDPSLLDNYEGWIKKYWKQAPKNFEVKLLTNDERAERRVSGKYERRHTKFWSATQNFLSTTWVIGDYVIILNTKQHPYYLIEIHDKLIAHDQREVFRGLWNMV